MREEGRGDIHGAAGRRRGVAVKSGFWPEDDRLLRLIRQFIAEGGGFLSVPVPAGVLAVPQTDNGLFIVNTTGKEMAIELSRGTSDRFSDTELSGKAQLKPFQVLWIG
jgi:hypothetical protein